MELLKQVLSPRYIVALGWLVFQIFILYDPLPLQVARPLHICFAVATVFLWQPLGGSGIWRRIADWLLLIATFSVLGYYLLDFDRLYT
ncbi:hypothetical protein JZU56_06375, partial [bacterium]|nr:hypothetical protein [bacterium]